MGLRIRTNIASLNSQRRLIESTSMQQESMAKLASGERINKSADDAAGMAIGTKMKADARSLIQAKRNANDGISVVQTAEGGIAETTNMLIRLRELAIQAASDTIGDRERGFIQKEYGQLKDEIDRIANSTEFNGTRLLVGNGEHAPSGLPDGGNPFPHEIHVGKSYYPDADSMSERNPVNIIRIDLSSMGLHAESLGIGATDNDDGTNVVNRSSAQSSITRVDDALIKIADYRSYLGSVQSRLQTTVRNLSISVENLEESRSRIMDTDFAEETAKQTSASILQQAGTSVLSISNQLPKVALSLIQGI